MIGVDRLEQIQQWCRSMEANGFARGKKITSCNVEVGVDDTMRVVVTVGGPKGLDYLDWSVADLAELLNSEPEWHWMDEFQRD